VLTIEFGPQFVSFVGGMFRKHLPWVLAGVAVALLIWLVWLRRKRRLGRRISANKNAELRS
jgi:hypothetical protein